MAGDRPERRPQHVRGSRVRPRADDPGRRLRPRARARGQDPQHGTGDRLVGPPRGRRALPLAARGARTDDGAARAVSHPNAELVERLFSGFRRDPVTVARSFAADAVWRVAGANPMTGEYRGRDEILRFLRQTAVLTNGTYRADLRFVVADD